MVNAWPGLNLSGRSVHCRFTVILVQVQALVIIFHLHKYINYRGLASPFNDKKVFLGDDLKGAPMMEGKAFISMEFGVKIIIFFFK